MPAEGDVHGDPAGAIEWRPWGERSFYAKDPLGNKICFVDECAWNNPPELVRVSRRSRFAAEAVMNILGFRCVRDVAPMEIREVILSVGCHGNE